MIVEERIYTLHPGKVPEYLRLYEAEGPASSEPILGNLVGWYTATDIGELNLIVHLWGYEDLADRARAARAAAGRERRAGRPSSPQAAAADRGSSTAAS